MIWMERIQTVPWTINTVVGCRVVSVQYTKAWTLVQVSIELKLREGTSVSWFKLLGLRVLTTATKANYRIRWTEVELLERKAKINNRNRTRLLFYFLRTEVLRRSYGACPHRARVIFWVHTLKLWYKHWNALKLWYNKERYWPNKMRNSLDFFIYVITLHAFPSFLGTSLLSLTRSPLFS